MKHLLIILPAALLLTMPSTAQVVPPADVTLSFDISKEGQRYQPTWGLDLAWISEQNLRKGINHMGLENIGIGRSCFRTTKALTNDSVLGTDQISYMRQRANLFNLVSRTLPLVLTADQEAGSDEYFVKDKSCDVDHWAANINSHVHWLQKNTKHPVVGISPFNEPDYWSKEEGATVAKQVQVARILKSQYPRMDTIAMVGGNTLNDDKAMEWYLSGRQYYDWGNTHQLAGSFDNFAAFYQRLAQDGKVGYADEMHNVAEAMVGLEYGMTVGIWWGFDSRARGEFCDISRHGERIAYGEHRDNWTAASVYRHDDGRVKAFIGSSERQAKTTSYQFISLDRDVYFDGYGPLRQYRMEIPGGTGYQTGQTNAERVIDITWGDDVPPIPITDGVYKLVNKATGNVVAVSSDNVVMQKYTGARTQQWNVSQSNPRKLGDYSFYDFTLASNGRTRMNVLNFSTENNANIMAYSQNTTPSDNEQWYLQYAGNGYYYIRNRESALYLTAFSKNTANGINVVQRVWQDDEESLDLQLWRLLPLEVAYDNEAPAQPATPEMTVLPAAVKLSWQQGSEEDLCGYQVLRSEDGTQWNTIARMVMPPFTDNTCMPGRTYHYRLKAVDNAYNQSVPSVTGTVTTQAPGALVAQWTMDGTVDDNSGNSRHGALAEADALFEEGSMPTTKALRFKDNQYVQLPQAIVQGDELTVSMWVKPMSYAAWQRLFDFGHDDTHYIFFTPSGGSKARLAIRNGGEEQVLDCPSRLKANEWRHVTVTMAPEHTAIYLDGALAASTSDITISPADVGAVVNYLGRSQFNSDPYYAGFMEDVRVYNYALTAGDVAQLFTSKTAVAHPLTEAMPAKEEQPVYSIDGIRIEKPRRGLNIVNGKVVLNQ